MQTALMVSYAWIHGPGKEPLINIVSREKPSGVIVFVAKSRVYYKGVSGCILEIAYHYVANDALRNNLFVIGSNIVIPAASSILILEPTGAVSGCRARLIVHHTGILAFEFLEPWRYRRRGE